MDWLKKKFSDLSTEIIGGLILIGFVSWAMIWAFLQSLGVWIIVIAFALVALGLLIMNQFHIVLMRHRRGFATMKNERIEATVRNWLDKQGYSIRNAPDPRMLFQFVATDNEQRNITVCRPAAEDNFIFIGGAWNIPPEIEKWFDKMPEDSREEMLEHLRIELLRMKVDNIGVGHPLRHVVVQVRVPCDETCTEAVFLQHWVVAKFAYIMMVEIMRGALRREGHDINKMPNQPPTPDKEGSEPE